MLEKDFQRQSRKESSDLMNQFFSQHFDFQSQIKLSLLERSRSLDHSILFDSLLTFLLSNSRQTKVCEICSFELTDLFIKLFLEINLKPTVILQLNVCWTRCYWLLFLLLFWSTELTSIVMRLQQVYIITDELKQKEQIKQNNVDETDEK